MNLSNCKKWLNAIPTIQIVYATPISADLLNQKQTFINSPFESLCIHCRKKKLLFCYKHCFFTRFYQYYTQKIPLFIYLKYFITLRFVDLYVCPSVITFIIVRVLTSEYSTTLHGKLVFREIRRKWYGVWCLP